MKMPVVWLAALLALLCGCAGAPRPSGTAAMLAPLPAFKQCLQSKNGSVVASYPGSTQYQVLQTRNAQLLASSRQPAAIVQPVSAAGVAAAVACSNMAGLKWVVRNGGHSYEALSLLAGGVVIDVGLLTAINIDAGAGVATIGAGQRLGPVYRALALKGFVLPGGTCPGVGVSGLTLGGGIGHSTRKLGFLVDVVEGATLVTANGTITTASATTNPDLFWAIRGGGPFYGVITSWRFRLARAPPKVAVRVLGFPAPLTQAGYAAVLTAFSAWQPWNLNPKFARVELFAGMNSLKVEVDYWGTLAQLNSALASSPLLRVAGVTTLSETETGWTTYIVTATNIEAAQEWGVNNLEMRAVIIEDARERSTFRAASLLHFQPLSPQAIKTMAASLASNQGGRYLQTRALRGAAAVPAADANAFPWRAALMETQVYAIVTSPADVSWVEGVRKAMVPHTAGGSAYYNYIDCNTATPWATYFGAHAGRLQSIKAKWDPAGHMPGPACKPVA